MTVNYYRDLGERDVLIVRSSEGIFSIDLTSIKVGCAKRIHAIPAHAQQINAGDVGRILVCACTRSINDAERRMGAAQ